MRKESALEAWAVRWATARAIPTAKLMQCIGIPDRVFFIPGGSPILIEFKRGKTSEFQPLQESYLEKLTADGYRAHAVAHRDEFTSIMLKAMDTAPIPRAWSKVDAYQRAVRAAAGPRNGKDINNTRSRKDSAGKEAHKAGANRRATAKCTAGVAAGSRRVE